MKNLTAVFFFLLHFYCSAQNTSCIKGVVTDQATAEVIPFCTVIVLETKAACLTDLDGNYKFEKLAPGNYTLVFKYTGYSNDTIRLKLNKDQIYFQNAALRMLTNSFYLHDGPYEYQEPLIEPNTLPGGTVTREEFLDGNLAGKIVNSKYPNEGVPFANVICVHRNFQATSGFDGKYIIRGLPPGKYL